MYMSQFFLLEVVMPVAKVYVPQGTLTRNQRRKIIEGIHEAIVTVRKAPADAPTYVLINDVPAESWGYTGRVYEPRG
jgi:4-oxalocrotonate tautomerase family enzyme